jgi:hypothetical protein
MTANSIASRLPWTTVVMLSTMPSNRFEKVEVLLAVSVTDRRVDAAGRRRYAESDRDGERYRASVDARRRATSRSTSVRAGWPPGSSTSSGEVVVRDRLATPARNVWPALTQLVGA